MGVVNQLITIPGGGHGNFTPEQRTMIYTTIQQFLRKNGLMAADVSPPPARPAVRIHAASALPRRGRWR